VAADALVRAGVIMLGVWIAVSPAAAGERRSPWSIRIGASLSTLEGAIGSVYPEASPGGMLGVSYRAGADTWRLRTGLDVASRSGHGEVPLSPVIFGISSIEENWRTTWVEAPLVLEGVLGGRTVRPFLGAGLVGAWRIAEDLSDHGYEVSPMKAHGVDASATATAGLERRGEHGTLRLELGFAHGLGDLYDSADGPAGSWRAWTLVLDAGL